MTADVLDHPTRDDSPESALEDAAELVEKMREAGNSHGYVLVLVGKEGALPFIFHSAMSDSAIATSAQALGMVSSYRLDEHYSKGSGTEPTGDV